MLPEYLKGYYEKLASFCAYQERAHKEVKEKLQKFDLNDEEIGTIIIALLQNNYLNEQRFATSYARGKFRFKKWGRKKIAHALQLKDVSSQNIQSALDEIDEEEYIQTLQKIIEQKYQEVKGKNDWEKKQKTYAHALSKGYESQLIGALLNNIE